MHAPAPTVLIDAETLHALASGKVAMDRLNLQQTSWECAQEGLAALREMLPLMAPLGAYRFDDPSAASSVRDLATAAARSAESATLLCAYDQLWDSELAMRSTMEASLKFCYILQAPHTFAERSREYSQDLFEIGLLKDHNKILSFLADLSDASAIQLRPLTDRILEPDQLERIQARLPKPVRAAVEGRWGFTGMLGALDRSNDELFSDIAGMAHSYSMASHIMHADPIGAMMPLERDHGSAEARAASHAVHLARLILDALILHRLRLLVAYRFVGAHRDGLARANELVNAANRRHDEAYRAFAQIEYPDDSAVAMR